MLRFGPLARAQFELAGGLRQNLLIVGGYLLLVVVLLGTVYSSAAPNDRDQVSAVFLVILSVVQGGLMLLLAPGAIRKAVLRDFQTGMIESHRLTPLDGLGLALGYLTGATAQAFFLYAAGLVVGGYVAGLHGQALGAPLAIVSVWYGSQICLLPLALLVGVASLLVALVSAGKGNLLVVLVLFSFMGGVFLLPAVPGLALLSGAFSAGLIGQVLAGRMGLTSDPAVLAWAMVFQLAIAVGLLAAACRKLRFPHRPAFSIRLGLVLLALWGAVLVAGVRFFAGFRWLFGDADEIVAWQRVGSTIAFLVVALLPLIAAAAARCERDRALRLAGGRSVRLGRYDLLPLGLALTTGLLWLVLYLAPRADFTLESVRRLIEEAELRRMGIVLLAAGLSLWTDYCLVYTARAGNRGPLPFLVVSWLVLKILPIVVEGVAYMVAELTDTERQPWVATFSPLGVMIMVAIAPVTAGLIFQGLVAAGVTLLARRCGARSTAQPPGRAPLAAAAGS